MRTTSRRILATLAVMVSMWGCGGNQSVQSLVDLQAPATVQNSQAFPGNLRVRVSWSPNIEPALVGYNIYRSTASFEGYTLVGSTGITQTPFFEDLGPDLNGDGVPDGLVNNVRYFYKVTAFDRNGRESNFDLASVVNAIPGTLPAGTTTLQVFNVRGYGGNGRAIVSWDLNLSSLVFGYNVYRSRVGSPAIFDLVATVPQNVNSFADAGLTNNVEYIYQIAPITKDYVEGSRTQSRPLRISEGGPTVPKPPGSAPSNGPVTIAATTAGIQLTFGAPTQNTNGTVIGINGTPSTLIGGGFLIKRGVAPIGEFRVVGILENIGTELNFGFLDPFGTPNDFYYVTCFDVTGNESAPSELVSVNTATPPGVQGVDAFAASSIGQIVVTWAASPRALDGYRVFRSTELNRGYFDVSGLLPNTVTAFTDADPALQIGTSYYYKVQAQANGIMGTLSPAAAATPGPSSGVFYLEGEDATVTVNNPTDFSALNREAFPAPFFGNGVFFMQASNLAVPNVSFVQMDWSMDIDATRSLTPVVRTYQVFISTIRNSSSGIFGISLGELLAATLAPPFACPPLLVQSKDFFRSTFGFPPTQTIELLGSICFPDESSIPPNGPNENVRAVFTYQGFNPAIAQGVGELFLDAIVLIRQ